MPRGRVTGHRKVEIDGRGGAAMILPGESEAGSAGTQPCRGMTRWAHRVDEVGGVGPHASMLPLPSSLHWPHRRIDPPCLENPRRAAAELRSLAKTTLRQALAFMGLLRKPVEKKLTGDCLKTDVVDRRFSFNKWTFSRYELPIATCTARS